MRSQLRGVKIEQIEDAIDDVFAKIAKDGISEAELNRARNAYIADYVYGNDSQSGLARRYGFALATGWSIQDIESYPERLKKVTVEDLQRVAAKYLDINSSVTGILIPKPKQMADKK